MWMVNNIGLVTTLCPLYQFDRGQQYVFFSMYVRTKKGQGVLSTNEGLT